MQNLFVNLDKNSYDISFHEDFLSLPFVLESINAPKKLFLITDSNVEKLYLGEVLCVLEKSGFETGYFSFNAGEENKNLTTIEAMISSMIKFGMDRKSCILALGGGVVGDMAGFASSIYMRGIDFVQIPTTLLSQSDSSVGGKTGVDFDGYKNIIGAFHQPKHVYINVSTLKTLPEREIISGLGEVIKHGIIKDKEFFLFLENNRELIKSLSLDTLINMTKTNCTIKADIVSKDEKESSVRAYLNFGHTVGHAIESLSEFKLSHGESVGLGMISASYISYKRGYIDECDFERILNVLESYGFKTKTEISDYDKVISIMMKDKKNSNGKIRFILPTKIGEVNIFDDVLKEEIIESLKVITK